MTFTDQLANKDVVVEAKLLDVPELPTDPSEDLPKATFEITKVLKGKQFVDVGMEFKALLVGRYKPGKKFLVMGEDPPMVVWTTPIVASERLVQYLADIQTLPASGADRLAFFQDYFEDDISAIAFDAYDEFAKAPYDELVALKDRMHRQQLLDWVMDPDTAINRRRLYLTMLGICGGDAEVAALEKLIKSGGSKNLRGLDALVASYLCLKGDSGVDLIEEKFLNNKEAVFTDTMGAVSALRFHATEVEIVNREKIVAAIRTLLDRPKMADLIIPDLSRWEDWSVMDKLVTMFKESADDKRWLRVPIVSYLKACPLPQAKTYLAELEVLDPVAVQQANMFGQGYDFDDDDDEDEIQPAVQGDVAEPQPAKDAGDANDSKEEVGSVESDPEFESGTVSVPVVTYKVPMERESAPTSDGPNRNPREVASSDGESSDVALEETDETSVAKAAGSSSAAKPPVAMVPYLQLKIIFIPLIVSVVLFVLLWSVVSGSFQRLIF